MADSFLVLVPHKTLHGTISIWIQRPKLAKNVGKMGAVKNKMPFIPQCPGPAQSAAAEMRGDGRFSKPTLFNRQGMRPHAELHQQPYPGNGHWKLKVRHSFQLTGTQKPCKVCAEFCPMPYGYVESKSRVLLGYLGNAAARTVMQSSPVRLAEESISLADALIPSVSCKRCWLRKFFSFPDSTRPSS